MKDEEKQTAKCLRCYCKVMHFNLLAKHFAKHTDNNYLSKRVFVKKIALPIRQNDSITPNMEQTHPKKQGANQAPCVRNNHIPTSEEVQHPQI